MQGPIKDFKATNKFHLKLIQFGTYNSIHNQITQFIDIFNLN